MTLAADFQMLVDGFGALGALAVAVVLLFRRARSQVQSVLMLVFGLAGAFYAFRALFLETGFMAFGLASLMLACTLPLGALILAEILLRRHAPLPVKIFIAGGAALGVLAAVIAGIGMTEAFNLAFYVPLGLGLVIALVLFRQRTSLAPMENSALDSYGRALMVTGLLTLTDFGLFGSVGLSALGMLGLAYAAAAGATAPRRWIDVLKELALSGAVALLLAGALLRLRHPESLLEAGGVAGVVTSAFLALAVLLRLRSGGSDQQRRLFEQTLLEADTTSLNRFLETASGAAPLHGLILAEAEDLTDYSPIRLREAFGAGVIATLVMLEHAPQETGREAREQLADLMRRHASTHAVMIGEAPLRIALIALAGSTRPEEDERSMALFQKMAMLVAACDRTERGS